jgi:hypothetical protein
MSLSWGGKSVPRRTLVYTLTVDLDRVDRISPELIANWVGSHGTGAGHAKGRVDCQR